METEEKEIQEVEEKKEEPRSSDVLNLSLNLTKEIKRATAQELTDFSNKINMEVAQKIEYVSQKLENQVNSIMQHQQNFFTSKITELGKNPDLINALKNSLNADAAESVKIIQENISNTTSEIIKELS